MWIKCPADINDALRGLQECDLCYECSIIKDSNIKKFLLCWIRYAWYKIFPVKEVRNV